MTDELVTRWRPLSVRESDDHAGYDALHPGVPSWLRAWLWEWVAERIGDGNPTLAQIERVFRIDSIPEDISYGDAVYHLRRRAYQDSEFFLDIVDYVASKLRLEFIPVAEANQLATMLDEAGSEWTLDDSSGRYGLVRRVPLEVRAAADQIMNTGDKAALHLRLAWNAVYGRHPDAGKGYGEAIKAMEVATIPVVCPSNLRATLGRVINDLRAKPDKWVVNLKHPTPDRQAETVADMLDLVWKGQSDRHGDPDPSAPISVSQEQAEAAVHLAVTVVQWFNTGVVTAR
jgi:hypothetical protein